MPGPWEKYGGQPAQPGGVVTVGNPRPPEPPKPSLPTGWAIGPDGTARPVPGLPDAVTNPTKNDAPSGYRFKPDGSLEAIPGGPADKGGKAGSDPQTALNDIGSVIKAARRAKVRSDGWFMTGFLSGLGSKTPAGASLQGDLDIIGSNVAFDRLQKMRAESPTGGALGSITENELRLLQNSTAAINPSQSDVDFQRNMESIIQRYSDIYQRLGGNPADLDEAQDKDNPNNAALYTRGDIGFNTPDGPDNPLTPEQQAAYDAWNKANPNATADQLNAFAQSIGVTLGNADEIVAARDKGAGVAPGSTAIDRLTPQEQQEVDKKVSETGGFMRTAAGVADTATLGTSNKLIAALRDLAGKGEYDRELLKQNAITDQIGQESPWLYHGGQFVGGLALPSFGAKTAGQIAKVGAGLGAGYGLGSSDSASEIPTNLLVGGAGGALGGWLGGQAGNYLGKISLRPRVQPDANMQSVINAAEQEGINIGRPIADPSKRTRMAYLESTPGGGGPVQESLSQTLSGIESRANNLKGEGLPQERGLMGQRVQDALQADLKAQRNSASGIYDQASQAAEGMQVRPTEIVGELDKQLAALNRNPNSNRALIDYLMTVRSDLVNEATGDIIPKTVDDLRSIRTNLAGEINTRNLTRTNAERLIGQALDKGRLDIQRDLAAQGERGAQAARLYREADVRWKLAKRDEKQIVEKLIGPANNNITGMAAMNRAVQWLQNGAENGTHARRFWAKLGPKDKADFAATVADKFGRKAPDEPFSPQAFIEATRAIPPSSRAMLFGEDGARSITNLRILTKAYQDSVKTLNNSRSGVVQNWAKFLAGFGKGGSVGALLGFATGGVPGGLAGGAALSALEVAGQRLSARALMSNDFSKWLAMAPKQVTEEAVTKHINRLGSIAAKEGAIATEISGLRQALLRAINDNGATLPVAADSQADQSRQQEQ